MHTEFNPAYPPNGRSRVPSRKRASGPVLLARSIALLMGGCDSSGDRTPTDVGLEHAILAWEPPTPVRTSDKAGMNCLADPVLADFLIGGETVDVIANYFDATTGVIKIIVKWPDTHVCRVIEFYRNELSSGYNGFVATSTDLYGRHKFGVAFSWEMDDWDWKRGVINIGGSLKCMFGGGIMNPLCHVYIGYTFAFGIADLLCDLGVDCD